MYGPEVKCMGLKQSRKMRCVMYEINSGEVELLDSDLFISAHAHASRDDP